MDALERLIGKADIRLVRERWSDVFRAGHGQVA